MAAHAKRRSAAVNEFLPPDRLCELVVILGDELNTDIGPLDRRDLLNAMEELLMIRTGAQNAKADTPTS